jgi:phospholipid/cholesterol/gamma-HCH transport system permease protein
MLAAIGRPLRVGILTLLQNLALSARMFVWSLAPSSWRGPARRELFRLLRQSLLGGLNATLFLGLLIGAGLVFQGIALAEAADQRELFASVLVRVLVRELAPALVGIIILGRSGLVALAELNALRRSGAARVMSLQGVDMLGVYALPAATAFALASLALGIFFVKVALTTGGALAILLSTTQVALFDSLRDVLRAMRAADVLIFPLKLLLIGGLVGVSAAHTALTAPEDRSTAQLLPSGFVRGALAVLLASAMLSLAG